MHLASRSKASFDPYAILLQELYNFLQIIPMKLARIYRRWSSRKIQKIQKYLTEQEER